MEPVSVSRNSEYVSAARHEMLLSGIWLETSMCISECGCCRRRRICGGPERATEWNRDVACYVVTEICLVRTLSDLELTTWLAWCMQVKFEQGIGMLNIFKSFASKTSILDDFQFYENRQRALTEKRARQQNQQQREQHRQVRLAMCCCCGNGKCECVSQVSNRRNFRSVSGAFGGILNARG